MGDVLSMISLITGMNLLFLGGVVMQGELSHKYQGKRGEISNSKLTRTLVVTVIRDTRHQSRSFKTCCYCKARQNAMIPYSRQNSHGRNETSSYGQFQNEQQR